MKIDNLEIIDEKWSHNTNAILVVTTDTITKETKTFFGSYILTEGIKFFLMEFGQPFPSLETKEDKIRFVIQYGEKINLKDLREL